MLVTYKDIPLVILFKLEILRLKKEIVICRGNILLPVVMSRIAEQEEVLGTLPVNVED